jgi:hypothetical protein
MFSIYLHGPGGATGYSDEEVVKQLSAICEKRGSGRALAFAFILYDYQSPHISKVLADLDYWNALDQLSGECLTVFSFCAKEEKQYPHTINNRHRIAQGRTDTMTQANKVIMEYFGQTLTMPALLFFQVQDSELIGSYLVKLSSTKVEDAFNEIATILRTAADSISKVTEENRRNTREIFGLIKRDLSGKIHFYKIKRTIKTIFELLRLLPH